MSISCVICGGKLDRAGVCPRCGYDLSRCRERYPTLADDGRTPPSISAILSQRFEQLSAAQAEIAQKEAAQSAERLQWTAAPPASAAAVGVRQSSPVSTGDPVLHGNTWSTAAPVEEWPQRQPMTVSNDAAEHSAPYPEAVPFQTVSPWARKGLAKTILLAAAALLVLVLGCVFLLPKLGLSSTQLSKKIGSGTCGEAVTWELYNDGRLIISGSGEMTSSPWIEDGFQNRIVNVTISSGVKSLSNYSFRYCRNLSSITIPNSVTSIGNWAFYNCGSLSTITIPDGVASIGNAAFFDCGSLQSISIPDSVTSIGDRAFSGCSSLSSVTIPDSVTSIEAYTFSGCGALSSITIPNSVISIGASTFSNCTSLSSVAIPDSVTSIGDRAFSGCSGLSSITIPNSVFRIGISAFSGCTGLRSITIPDSMIGIGERVFSGCINLSAVTIPDNVTGIGMYAFLDCASLNSITIPNSVIGIGYGAFNSCTSLSSVTIPNSVTHIEEGAFYDCTNLTDVYYTGTQEQWNNISIGDRNSELTNAYIHYNSN